MDTEVEIVEPRLRSFISQLQAECSILDRIVYKNKNQHRRCSYFQYLLKVRSDLRLLQSANLGEIVKSSFLVINGDKANQKVQLLESLKRRKTDGGKQPFLMRLQGAARLLSQMVEPMLKAAMYPLCGLLSVLALSPCFRRLRFLQREISTLLARGFFMGFSMTVLALLARLRVLVQQILLDIVLVFNIVSSISQKQQSIKLTQEGIEVFREYYPANEHAVFLECVWEKDKFVLLERITKPVKKRLEMDKGDDISQGLFGIQYQSIETILGEDGIGKVATDRTSEETAANTKEVSPSTREVVMHDHELVEDPTPKNLGVSEPSSKNLFSEDESLTSSSPHLNPLKLKSESGKKVAFVSVKKPLPSVAKETQPQIELPDKNGVKERSIFQFARLREPER